jgi:hypothetical protein
MSSIARCLLLAGVLQMLPIAAWAQSITFADTATGALPKDFVPALTGQGRPGRWEVVEDGTAKGGKALAQLDPDRTDYRFPLAIFEPTIPADVEVTIRFKPISGKVDEAGGVAVRLTDRNNYYLARANALEDNVTFYRVVAGKRQQIAGAKMKVTPGEWHNPDAPRPRQRIHGAVRRQAGPDRQGRALRRAREGRAVDEGRQHHPLRPPRDQAPGVAEGEGR